MVRGWFVDENRQSVTRRVALPPDAVASDVEFFLEQCRANPWIFTLLLDQKIGSRTFRWRRTRWDGIVQD